MTAPAGHPDQAFPPGTISIPRHSDPFVQSYLQGREALMREESHQRADHKFTSTLSPTGEEAHNIIRRLRRHEASKFWSRPPLYPGMPFALARPLIEEKSRLYKVIRRLPKGALLHVHLNAMMRTDILIEGALEEPGMCMWADGGLTEDTMHDVSIGFCYAPGKARVNSPKAADIWEKGYRKGMKVPVREAAEKFPYGGKEGFVAWLRSRCAFTATESISQSRGVDCAWSKFETIFGVVEGLFQYEPIFRRCLRQMFKDLVDDGVKWVEFRMCFVGPYRRHGSKKDEVGHEEMVAALWEEINIFTHTEEGKGFWGVRLIWTTLRSMISSDVLDDMLECIQAKKAYPELIAGYDFVGQEDAGRPLTSLLPELFFFKKRTAQENINIPFFFHAAETLGFGSEADGNLYDAVILGSRRLGHATSLYKHPLLMNMIKERKVCVELCPISEEVLGLTHNILAHPGAALIAHGVSCVLSSDDPSALGYGEGGGVSLDFWQCLMGWEDLGLAGLGSLAENSVRHAAFEDLEGKEWEMDVKKASVGKKIRAKRMKEWRLDWERFCGWIVDEFGDEFGDESTAAKEEQPRWKVDEDAWDDEEVLVTEGGKQQFEVKKDEEE
ncbi:MAG: hypothetical protein M1814_004964 [Vezdaea aestivalis]|nr:MAG: hypothetical protein M1814_004964 [Vezdaea aestivalis]